MGFSPNEACQVLPSAVDGDEEFDQTKQRGRLNCKSYIILNMTGLTGHNYHNRHAESGKEVGIDRQYTHHLM